MWGFRLLFSEEAIEMQADSHFQNSLSGKDIMLLSFSLPLKAIVNYT